MPTPSDAAGMWRDAAGSTCPEVTGTRRDVPVLGQTRRETGVVDESGPSVAPVTRRDGAPVSATRREGCAPALGPVAGFPTLPADVAGRYRPVAMLARQGAEADVFLVTDDGGREWALKVYRRDVTPDPEVWAALPRASSPYLVHVREIGTTLDQRKFEVMEYLSGGDLRGFAVASGGSLDGAVLRTVVSQLSEGLAALHSLQVIHRDLKPENVLVRSASPVELVLTDFGLSRRLDQTSVYSTAARTLLYTAPETFAGHVSPARDWWSLGVIVRELVTGERPFAGWTEEVIVNHLISRPIDLSGVTDPRVLLLCRGLLTRDSRDRWGAAEVRDWLAGGSPPVPDSIGPSRAADAEIPPFTLFGAAHRDPAALAAAMVDRWEDAARVFFAVSTSERWKSLKSWLAHFDDSSHYRGERRQEVCDELDAHSWRPDVKLLRLLNVLDPKLPPIYRTTHLVPEQLPALAVAAAAGNEEPARVVEDLWNAQLLVELSRRPEAGQLDEIDSRWRATFADYERAAEWVANSHPKLRAVLTEADARRWVIAPSLALAAGGNQIGHAMRAQLEQLSAGMPTRVRWFDDLMAETGRDAVWTIVLLRVVGTAVAEAEQMVREERIRQAQMQARQEEWEQREVARLAGRGAAIGYALGGVGVLAVLWMLCTAFGSSRIAGLVVAAILTQAVIEIGLAIRMGRDYHPAYSLLRYTGMMAGRVGHFLHYRPSVGCLGIIATFVGLSILTAVLRPAVPVAVLLGHLVWALRRWQSWQEAHAVEQRTILGQVAP